jgi:ABC-type uncharacterized transport system substrate-binding protein
VVSNQTRNVIVINAARAAAPALGLSIVEYSAQDLREATQLYFNILKFANPKTDALWLLEGDDLIDLQGTLPQIVEAAWTQHFIVIADVAEYVNRGALIATYLDASALGTKLASLAVNASPNKAGSFVLNDAVKFAINVRTASHLGIETSGRLENRYGIVVGQR